ncbi:sigma-70 family RNA polymerase sigma factor [Accumulibacter sp.]|uniref:sigma-70 family RNA polymerase sigma factor n=1 Tax=Accumulibacter sp. TaxID=2053492 RepID=UPI0028C3F366|nr:sigma-70 family RNA polymerase sigma factor [Accumulibacter sp.]
MSVPCLMSAWSISEKELRAYLRQRMPSPDDAEDLLQDVFTKALRQGARFCEIEQPRAWLFRVARNALADRLRVAHAHLPLPDDLATPATEKLLPVDDLGQCLPRVLSELSESDRLAITLCDIQGRPQRELAERLGISLSGAKSRIQRARLRLKAQMEVSCQVRYEASGEVADFVPRPPLPPS